MKVQRETVAWANGSLTAILCITLAGCSLTRSTTKSSPERPTSSIPSGSAVPQPPPDVLSIPDAVPRAEPRGTRGNPQALRAGTIALELDRMDQRLDAIFVPLGNGSLINGIGAWVKHSSPKTAVIGVCAEGAPSMELSWRAGKPVSTSTIATIADGIGVRVPVAEALAAMRSTVDEVMLVGDEEILEAMRMLFVETGLVVEPAGAAGLAAIARRRDQLAGQRVATPLCGGNLTEDQIRRWLT